MKTIPVLILTTINFVLCTTKREYTTINCDYHCICFDEFYRYTTPGFKFDDSENSTSYSFVYPDEFDNETITHTSHYGTRADCRSRNFTRVMTDVLTNATELMLSHNRITSLPGNIFVNYSNLDSLDLGYNRISHIDSEAFVGLTQLSALRLSNKKLAILHSSTFDPLSMLYYLDIGSNHFKHMPILNSLIGLNVLNLAGNKLEDVNTDHLPDLPDFFSINLQSNNLRYFPNSLAYYLVNYTSAYCYVAVSGNPWICDCHIATLKTIWPQHPRFLVDSIYCEQPKALSGENIWNIPNHKFVCGNDKFVDWERQDKKPRTSYSASELIGACVGSIVLGVIISVLAYMGIVLFRKLRIKQGSRGPTFVRMEDS